MPKHTLSIFRIIMANLPPLFPRDISDKMKNALEQLENDPRATLKMAEDMMVKFGYDLWPWNEAYKEFLVSVEGRLGEHFLLSHLSAELGANYIKYQKYGLSWKDLYSGRAAQYFTPEERPELTKALFKTKNDLLRFNDQEILSLHKEKYIKRVEEFKVILEKIKSIILSLRQMADEEEYHPVLADEIRERAKFFEMGLCLLAPSFSVDEATRALEFFGERKYHLNMMRGIEKPAEIDIYNS